MASVSKQQIISKLGAVGKPMQTNELLIALGIPAFEHTFDLINAVSNICLDGTDDIVYVNNYGWKLKSLCGFVAIYKGAEGDIWATSQWDAKKKAVEAFKIHKRHEHLLSVTLAIKSDGSQHTISTTSL